MGAVEQWSREIWWQQQQEQGQEGKSDEWVDRSNDDGGAKAIPKTWQDTTTSRLRYEEIGCGSSV